MRFSTWAAEDSGEAREKYGFTPPRLRLQLWTLRYEPSVEAKNDN